MPILRLPIQVNSMWTYNSTFPLKWLKRLPWWMQVDWIMARNPPTAIQQILQSAHKSCTFSYCTIFYDFCAGVSGPWTILQPILHIRKRLFYIWEKMQLKFEKIHWLRPNRSFYLNEIPSLKAGIWYIRKPRWHDGKNGKTCSTFKQ